MVSREIKAQEPLTSLCIYRQQFRQTQLLPSCNTWSPFLLTVYYILVLRARVVGIHWSYGSWKEGFILIDRDLTLPLICQQLPCTQTSHQTSEKLLLYHIAGIVALIVPFQNLFVFYSCLSASTKPAKQKPKPASCYMCKWFKGSLDRFQAADSVQLTELQIKVWALSVLCHNLHYLKSLWEHFLNALGWSAVFLRTVLLPLQSHYLWYCVTDPIREII